MKLTLLSALPHSRIEIDKARSEPRKDYVRGILRGYCTAAEAIWSDMEPILDRQAKQLFDQCHRHGVEVRTGAGTEELSAAAGASDVLIVLAHWKPGRRCV